MIQTTKNRKPKKKFNTLRQSNHNGTPPTDSPEAAYVAFCKAAPAAKTVRICGFKLKRLKPN